MAKIKKIKEGTATVYPATIPQAVVDPTSGKSVRQELDEKKPITLTGITYQVLKTLRDSSELTPGTQYKITDYVTTTTQANTQSAGIAFDVIVVADTVNKLNEKARATQRVGGTYFSNSNLSAWQLWYDLDNDTDKYEWADTINGRGVIYRMIDEFNNDIPYDFKNIQFLDNPQVVGPAYTFTTSLGVDLSLLRAMNIHSNSMKSYIKNISGVYKQSLNRNIFIGANCYSNTFGSNCYGNTFGYVCYGNNFGDACSSNTFGNYCRYNTFGNDCSSNTFGSDYISNTFGNDCFSNTFGLDCRYNTFGNHCFYNTFGLNCFYNTFGNYCRYNTFGSACSSNTFIESVSGTQVGDNYYLNWTKRSLETDVDISITPEGIYQNIKSDSNGYTPVAHPNYSTQETILPQKFGNQLVYERVIYYDFASLSMNITNLFPTSNVFPISLKGWLKLDTGMYIPIHSDMIMFVRDDNSVYEKLKIKLNVVNFPPEFNQQTAEAVIILEYTIPSEGGYY